MGALVIAPLVEGGSSEGFVGGSNKKKHLLAKKNSSTAYESLARLKSTFLDISCFICVLHGGMCPFCRNYGCFGGTMARLPLPLLDQLLPPVIFSRSGRLVMTAEHGNCSF